MSGIEIVGIGTDIVECERIGRMIREHGELFLKRVYTPREIDYCQKRRRAEEHFAARWAAKEAVLKALGTGWTKGIQWTDIEVRHAPSGRPKVAVRRKVKTLARRLGLCGLHLSLSHCRQYAVACVVAVRRAVPGSSS
jgi:holo-[acyl-carrier protein] synthase